jgi:hypothetical protein
MDESRRVGEGPRGAGHGARRRGPRPAGARRYHRRRHRRQHRHRPRRGRQRARLPGAHRHAEHAEPGEGGHAARLRRPGEADSRPCPIKQPGALRAHLEARCRGAGAAPDPRGAFWANQFDNTANRHMHTATTAPEIFEQTGGRVDGFICAVGTGGTLGGVAYGLRERSTGGEDRPVRPHRLGAVQPFRPRRAQGRGQLRSARASATVASPPISRASTSTWRSGFPTASPCRWCSS